MPKPALPILALFSLTSLNSCTFYLKDLIHGDPTKRPVAENYQEAKAEGFTDEEAQRRALLIGNDTDETRAIKAQRRLKEKEVRDENNTPLAPLIFWD